MRSVLLLSIFVLASCGRVENPINQRVGELRSRDPITVADGELTSLRAVCAAIASKTPQTQVGSQFQFRYTRKDCADDAISEASTVTTTLQNTVDGFKFVQQAGVLFYFADIETTDRGSMASVCASLAAATVTNPITVGNEAIFFSGNATGTDCPGRTNESCVALQRGTLTQDGQARIHTKEWIRFNLDPLQGRAGFFTLKRQITSAGCPLNQEVAHSAELR